MTITFDRPFDRHRLTDAIEIVSADARRIHGVSMVGPGETAWSFTPADPWPAEPVHVRVADDLEDVAGNNLRAVLERDLAGTPGHATAVT